MKQRQAQDTRYALGTLPNNLATLKRLGIPNPDQVVFSPASIYYKRADGSRVGDGFASVQWIWDVISIKRLANLLSFLDGGDYKTVYIRTDKRDGTFPNPRSAFVVYLGMMLKPILSGQEGVPIARSPYTLQTVSIQFNRLEEQSGYL